MRVLVPTLRSAAGEGVLAPRVRDLKGATIGLLSNGKPNSMKLLRAIGSRLVQNHGVNLIEADKSVEGEGAGDPSPDPLLEKLASGTIAVLAASGD